MPFKPYGVNPPRPTPDRWYDQTTKSCQRNTDIHFFSGMKVAKPDVPPKRFGLNRYEFVKTVDPFGRPDRMKELRSDKWK